MPNPTIERDGPQAARLIVNVNFFSSPLTDSYESTRHQRNFRFPPKARICWGFFWAGHRHHLRVTLCGALLGGVAGSFRLRWRPPKPPHLLAACWCGHWSFLHLPVLRWLCLPARKLRLLLVHAQEKNLTRGPLGRAGSVVLFYRTPLAARRWPRMLGIMQIPSSVACYIFVRSAAGTASQPISSAL